MSDCRQHLVVKDRSTFDELLQSKLDRPKEETLNIIVL